MLTREEIQNAMPGRSLDRLVAPLAGWVYQRGGHWISPENGMGHFNPPLFSASISEAWPLFAGNGWILQEDMQCVGLDNQWAVFADGRAHEDYLPLGEAATAELAICRAALAAHYLAAETTEPKSPATLPIQKQAS